MRTVLLVISALITMGLSACATSPQTAPIAAKSGSSVAGFATLALFGTYEMELAPVYTRLASLRHRAARSLESGQITVDTAIRVQALADQARAKADAARRGDLITPTAEQRLSLSQSLGLIAQAEHLLEQ